MPITTIANAIRASLCIGGEEDGWRCGAHNRLRSIAGFASDGGRVTAFLCRFHITEMHFSIISSDCAAARATRRHED